jgi:AMMECR1 domain-containing protein
MMRATAVFPVPGGPRKTRCCIGFSVPYPASARLRAASIEAAIERI